MKLLNEFILQIQGNATEALHETTVHETIQTQSILYVTVTLYIERHRIDFANHIRVIGPNTYSSAR